MVSAARIACTIATLVAVLTTGTASAAPAAQAAQPVPVTVALTPVIQDRVLGPKETSTTFEVQLSNQNEVPITFTLSTNDFTTLNQTGGLTFLGSDIKRVTNGHGLSGILRLDATSVTVPPKSTKNVAAHVDNLAQLATGGHYAAIIARVVSTNSGGKDNKISINQAVSSLVFLETAGQGTKTLHLLPPAINRLSFALPGQENLIFQATGNTQTIPRGIVTILRGEKVMKRGIINENSSLILPGSSRLFTTALQGGRHPWMPGVYTLRVEYRYEGSLGVTTYEKQFLYVNMTALLMALAAIALAGYLVVLLRKYWPQQSGQSTAPFVIRRVVKRGDNNHKSVISDVTRNSKK